MTTTRITFAAALLLGSALGMTGGFTPAQAHTPERCQKQISSYSKLCKFSPTAWLIGACETTQTYKWCSDKKLHTEKFHK